MVATINYYGITEDFFGDAFDDIDVTSNSATQIVLTSRTTGFTTTLTGNSFARVESNPSGNLTGFLIRDAANNPVFSVSGVTWSLGQFAEALEEVIDGNDAPLMALFNQQASVFDATGADMGSYFSFSDFTRPVTALGSDFADTLGGGDADDVINPGNAPEYDGNVLRASPGSDLFDLGSMGPNRYLDLTYETLNGPISVTVNGSAGTASVAKPGGEIDSLINLGNVLGYGFGLWGTQGDDSYTLNPGAGNWMQVMGMAGNDTFNLTLEGVIRLTYAFGYEDDPFTGIVANLGAGVISNDGFGFTDTLNITEGSGRLELHGTAFADDIIGSHRDERFILEAGDDTLDAGGGRDVLRYDRNGVDGIWADLEVGTVTGFWWGDFFTHTISNVEVIRGSDYGDNVLSGDAGDNSFESGSGNDLLQGFGGEDDLFGGAGNDFLDPGDSDYGYDHVDPGAGYDEVELGGMEFGFVGIDHFDLRYLTGLVLDLDMTLDNGRGGVDAVIDKGAHGITDLYNIDSALLADGALISGSEMDDVFNVTLTDAVWLELRGGRGVDSYHFDTAGPDGEAATVRLDFRQDAGYDPATQGLDINLGTGVIANDGFGYQEQISGNYDYRIEVRGTAWTDRIIGSEADDRFIGQGGNDVIDGRGGWDLLRFDRNDIDSGVDVDLAAGTASGIWNGAAFLSTISNIEEVRGTRDFGDRLLGTVAAEDLSGHGGDDMLFADGAAAAYYGATIANQVFRLYQATLDRTPDAGGHAAWSGRIASGERSLLEVTQGFVGSQEFQTTYSNLSDSEFVTLLYNNVLGTETPDAAGLAHWTSQLANGASRAEVVLGFAQSPQFIAETKTAANTYAQQSLAATWSDDVFRLYQATLDRMPDVTGQTTWTGRIASGERSLLEVTEGFVRSPEFQATYSNLSDSDFVTLLYNNVLGTETPDAAGMAHWTGELAAGASRAQVVLGFSQSPQFTAETQVAVKTWMRDQGVHDTVNPGADNNQVAGGQFADLFIFEAGATGSTVVRDLEVWDYIELKDFGFATAAAARAEMSQVGADVVFDDQGVEIIFANTSLAQITHDMIWV